MPRIIFENMGRVGIVKDRPPHDLPLEAWSDGNNVRFFEDSVQRMLGHSPVWTPVVDPWWLLPVQTEAQLWWMYPGAAKVYVVDQAGTHTDITRTVGGDYAPNFQAGWNGGVLNGIPVITDWIDVPQMWNPPQASTKLAPLTAWDANNRAKVIRPLRNFLVALDITKTGTRYPFNVLWSHSALPGAVPSSWDTTDATKNAGEVPLAETGGFVIDMVPLRDIGIIYKEDSTWIMQFVGGNAVFRFLRLKKFGGILTRHCARAFDANGEKHFVVTRDDVIVHDGQTSTSVVDKRVRRWLGASIDQTNYQRTHVFHNPFRSELGIAIPSSTGHNTKAALWNYKDDKWSIRDLPSAYFVESGLISPAVSDVWDSDPGVWDADPTVWDERPFGGSTERMLIAVPGSSKKLYLGDDTNQFDGANFNSYVERTGLAIIGQDREGRPKYDLEAYKLCTEIWPRVRGDAGALVNISVATQEQPSNSVSWKGPFPFIIGTDKKVNPMVGGKLLGVKFEFPGAAAVQLTGFDMELMITGKY